MRVAVEKGWIGIFAGRALSLSDRAMIGCGNEERLKTFLSQKCFEPRTRRARLLRSGQG
jgi:hypothetical protein